MRMPSLYSYSLSLVARLISPLCLLAEYFSFYLLDVRVTCSSSIINELTTVWLRKSRRNNRGKQRDVIFDYYYQQTIIIETDLEKKLSIILTSTLEPDHLIMGCGASKDQTQELAGDFFGANDRKIEHATPTIREEEPAGVSESSYNRHSNKQQQQQQQQLPSGSNNREKRARKSDAAAASRKSNTRKSNGGGARKSNYVAPPSSESFVQVQQRTVQPQQVTPMTPPPPPAGEPSDHSRQLKAHFQGQTNSERSKPRKLDDDDFSVAPSLDVEMRSIVNHTFDDIYQRGKKVSRQSNNSFCLGTLSCILQIGIYYLVIDALLVACSLSCRHRIVICSWVLVHLPWSLLENTDPLEKNTPLNRSIEPKCFGVIVMPSRMKSKVCKK